ncbi:Ger(x)C family spore germination protein [Tissierella praeacuta]|uniref:Ger(x)C family spore germination protein n=1 Tax=Tissierella praeacuta TaxID=43131 RepID=UPI0033405006
MKKILLIIMIVFLIFNTGCWGMIEINQRIFPYSVGVDLNDGPGDKYIITISYPNINSIGKNATQEDRIHVVSTVSSSLFEGIEQLSTRLPYEIYFKHLKVVVFGQELAKDKKSVEEIVDGLSRDFVINKKIRMLVAEGMARDLLLFVPKAKRQEVIEGTLISMLRDDKSAARFTPQSLTQFIMDTDVGGVGIMPRVSTHEDDIKIFGGAIFKRYEDIGDINEIQNRAVALMTGKLKRDLIDADYKGVTISYSIDGSKVRKKLIRKDGDMKVRISIEIEGSLQEYILEEKPLLDNVNIIDEMEIAIENVLEEEMNETLERLQKEYKADILQIGKYLYKYHPKVWKEVEKDWDEIFSEMDIEVVVDAKIRRRGLVQ